VTHLHCAASVLRSSSSVCTAPVCVCLRCARLRYTPVCAASVCARPSALRPSALARLRPTSALRPSASVCAGPFTPVRLLQLPLVVLQPSEVRSEMVYCSLF
jgi:hypothetical protein